MFQFPLAAIAPISFSIGTDSAEIEENGLIKPFEGCIIFGQAKCYFTADVKQFAW